ncbi:MAG: hypothetical protein A2076_04715 [Geobacteraceae bacterium GWC2_53_11]|nr:MAG: hypothetical protein A2076_04715 [Geobacteraceae bacterium GWC2_53_11]
MRGREIIAALNERRGEKDCFVKWWRKENDFLDYDLIDRFVANTGGTDEIGGLDLLGMDDMWNEISRIGGTRVTLLHDADGDKVKWVHQGKTGQRINVCSFTPETLMEIYDVETKGNPVDS